MNEFERRFRLAICAWNNVPPDHALKDTQCFQATKEGWERVFRVIAEDERRRCVEAVRSAELPGGHRIVPAELLRAQILTAIEAGDE